MNKIAFITGATSGIGQATAEQMAALGFSLILCGRREDRLQTMADKLSQRVKVHTLLFDVRNCEAVNQAINSLPTEWQAINLLVNNAGNAHGMSPIQDGNVDDWDAMIDGNVKGLLYVSKAIIPGMVARKIGHIINIGSIAGKEVYTNGNVYCASKFAVDALTQGMRLDLNPYGIKVTGIHPGLVETEFSLVRFKGDESRAEKIYQGFDPLQAEDIADAILYAVNAPSRVTIADITILAAAQSAAMTIHRK